MPLPIIPFVIAGLGGLAAFKVWKRNKGSGMTAERKAIYEAALQTLKDPAKLRKLAEQFNAVGLKEEGTLLEKRAALRELPDDVKKARKTAFRTAMKSTNQPAILQLAVEFDKQGATGAAAALRKYAAGLPNVG